MLENERVKAWITKYAMTQGIFVIEGEVSPDSPNMVCFKTGYWTECYHGMDWHRTPEAALKRAEEMRRAKLSSLAKSVAKIEKLRFVATYD